MEAEGVEARLGATSEEVTWDGGARARPCAGRAGAHSRPAWRAPRSPPDRDAMSTAALQQGAAETDARPDTGAQPAQSVDASAASTATTASSASAPIPWQANDNEVTLQRSMGGDDQTAVDGPPRAAPGYAKGSRARRSKRKRASAPKPVDNCSRATSHGPQRPAARRYSWAGRMSSCDLQDNISRFTSRLATHPTDVEVRRAPRSDWRGRHDTPRTVPSCRVFATAR